MVFRFLLFVALAFTALATDFYVATTGSDANPGTIGSPFATLNKAKTAIEAIQPISAGVNVWLRGGRYFLQTPFLLTGSSDSGTPTALISYKNYQSESAFIIGGTNVGGFTSVTNASVLARLTASAKTNVLQAQLSGQGITDYGVMIPHGYANNSAPENEQAYQSELLFQDAPMQLARWPNVGSYSNIQSAISGSQFGYAGSNPGNWLGSSDIWVGGFWYYDWSDSLRNVTGLDTVNKIVTVSPTFGNFGVGQRFYFLNILEELDSPGEYYIDRTNSMLYFWPPNAITNGACLLTITTNIVSMNGVSNVVWSGITFEGSRQSAIAVNGGNSNTVAGCTITGSSGDAVSVTNCIGFSVNKCILSQAGQRGIHIFQAGTRSTLTSGAVSITSNQIFSVSRICRTEFPPIHMRQFYPNEDVVGTYIGYNTISNVPHMAILLLGNNHTIEYNEIHHVCTETADAGEIYCGGDWSFRGNVVRVNYIHDVNVNPGVNITGGGQSGYDGVKGVYLDDGMSGFLITSNIFENVDHAVYINGGRGNQVTNNFFVDCTNYTPTAYPALATWMGQWIVFRTDLTNQLVTRLQAMPYQTAPWSTQYPDAVTTLTNRPYNTVSNLFSKNVFFNCLTNMDFGYINAGTNGIVTPDNLTNANPLFANYNGRDFWLNPGSPALALGINQIPYWTWPIAINVTTLNVGNMRSAP